MMPSKMYNPQEILSRLERIGGMGHWRIDLQDNSLYWSEGCFAIHGLNPDKYTPSLDTAINAYVPEDREHVQRHVERAIQKSEPYTFECRIQRPDDTIRTVFSSGEMEKDKDGNNIAVFGVIHDITELREYETRFQLAAMGSASVMWDWDVVNDRLHWAGHINEILGYDTVEDMPKNSLGFFSDLVHPDDRLTLKNAFADHFSKKASYKVEMRIRKQDGSYAWFTARAQAQWDKNDKAIRMSGSLTDVNDLKIVEQKLKRSNEDLNQFASIAAHDLQQPLRSISGFLTLLKDKYIKNLDDTANKYIDQTIKSAESMSELVRDLLEYSRIETDNLQYKLCDIEELVTDILHTMEQTLETEKVTINTISLPQIVCDKLKIHRVFYNLIENAIKYSGNEDPVVTLTATQLDNADWVFKISDNGIGIDKAKHDDVFKMFTRLHKKAEYEGTGVGLAICKKVVDLHHGEIWIESNSENGTTFAFTIPQKTSIPA